MFAGLVKYPGSVNALSRKKIMVIAKQIVFRTNHMLESVTTIIMLQDFTWHYEEDHHQIVNEYESNENEHGIVVFGDKFEWGFDHEAGAARGFFEHSEDLSLHVGARDLVSQVDGFATEFVLDVAVGTADQQSTHGARTAQLLHTLHGQVQRRVAVLVCRRQLRRRQQRQEVRQRYLRTRVTRPVQWCTESMISGVDVDSEFVEVP